MDGSFKFEHYPGLTEQQAKDKLLSEGFNELPSSKPKSLLRIALGIAKEPMFLLLVACGSLYLLLGDIHEGLMLMSFVVFVMGIEFYQEKKTEKALDALKNLASPRALVIRDGETKRIPGREVVTDDIIFLQEGDRVPADALVLNAISILADESLLTGESVPVRKREWHEEGEKFVPGGDDLPCVWSGSMIVQGNGVARVIATGIKPKSGTFARPLNL